MTPNGDLAEYIDTLWAVYSVRTFEPPARGLRSPGVCHNCGGAMSIGEPFAAQSERNLATGDKRTLTTHIACPGKE